MSSGITKLLEEYKKDYEYLAFSKMSEKFRKQEQQFVALLGDRAYESYLKLREAGRELVSMRVEDALIYAYKRGKENRFKVEE